MLPKISSLVKKRDYHAIIEIEKKLTDQNHDIYIYYYSRI